MKKQNKEILLYLGIIFTILLVLNLLLVIPNISEIEGEINDEDLDVEDEESIRGDVKEEEAVEDIDIERNITKVEMMLPAADKDGKGVATTLEVEAIPNGTGKTLTDIDNILFWADTQHSIRMAKLAAEEITGMNVNDYDLIYSIDAKASVVGGPSAGAAMSVATIGALTGRRPNKSVIITGRVNHDGSIGPASAILEKAKASKDIGAKLFLTPLSQSEGIVYERSEHCEDFGHTEICQEEVRPIRVDIASDVGIDVREVGSIKGAKEYFFS